MFGKLILYLRLCQYLYLLLSMDVKKEEEKLLMEMFFYGGEMIEDAYLATAYRAAHIYWAVCTGVELVTDLGREMKISAILSLILRNY